MVTDRMTHPPKKQPYKQWVQSNRKKLDRIIYFAVSLILTLIIISPLFWMLRLSFSPKAELFIPKIIFDKPNFEGYLYFFASSKLLTYYFNSVMVAIGTLLVCLTTGICAAYSFSRFHYRGKNTLMMLTLSAQMFPWALLLISIYMFFSNLKLLDSHLGLVLAHSVFALPLTTWMIKGYFDTIPFELEESAFIDGCSRLRILSGIIVPVSRPGIIAASIYIFIFSWNDYIFGLTLTTKDYMRTLAPGIALSFLGEYETQWVNMMAASLIISVPTIVLFFFLQRYFISGLTAGAVKG